MSRHREVSNNEDILDSRDIQARIEELENDGVQPYSEEEEPDNNEERAELTALLALREEVSYNSGDSWKDGATLIRDSYFEEYAEQLADDIGAIDRNASWPICHIDWAAAAESLKQDYSSVDFNGVEYWVRA